MRVLMIEARWPIRIADDLRRAGHALDGLLKEVGLVRADFASPEDRIPYTAYVGLIERAAMLLASPAYGLKLGASHDIRDNGLLGFLALNSPTLSDALANGERYVSVTNEGIDAVFEHDGKDPPYAFARAMHRCAACGTIRSRRPPRWSGGCPRADSQEGGTGARRVYARAA